MSTRDDLSRVLPDAPPPRPAQRRAAIEKAMARFDGIKVPGPARAGISRTGPVWRWPQLAALTTAALVGVVSVSLWDSGAYREAPVPRSSAPVRAEQVEPARTASSPPAALTAIAPADSIAAPSAPIAELLPERRTQIAPDPAAPRAAEEAAPPPPAAFAAPPPPPPAPAQSAPSAARANVDTAVAEDITAFPDSEGIVVTGTRTQRMSRAPRSEPLSRARVAPTRGDWNACTIDDPARSLAACRATVDPAAPGHKGRADAQIADGLSRAWAGNARGAASAFDRAVKLSGESSLAYLNRGLARERGGDLRGALADLGEAVRLSPQSARAYYQRSLVRERSGDANGARADSKRALALDPAYRAVIR